MAKIDERRRKMALDRKKKLDDLRKKSGRVKTLKVVFKKGPR